ncbi:MAG: glycoside hydrolase family 25 protein [Candidatus Merdivicinus sp.]|jgi:GH25 family lysozyme M1 (1,4-beta-N-acetylmuramidase)
MEQPNSKQPKRKNGLLGFLTVSNVLLALALVGVIATVWFLEDHKAEQAMAQAQSLQQQLEDTQAELENLRQSTIPIETFQGYAAQYGVSSEFIQQFFPDKMIYKDATGIVYADIDDTLPKNSYDWQYLSRSNGRFSYEPENGQAALLGVDVSRHQGEIDWQKVKADGIQFAMLRGVYRGYGESGNLLVDEMLEQNLEGALAAGLDVGIYVFSQAVNEQEAIEEAELVLEQIQGHEITYPIVFDMEEIAGGVARTSSLTPEEVTDIAIAFCDTIEEAGYHPMIYGNLKWLVSNMQPERLTEYDKWLAQYYRTPAFPYEFQMWQYTNSGTVDGISGNVDLNLCFTAYP